MEEYNNKLDDFQSKLKTKLALLTDTEKIQYNDIVESYEILKGGKSLDYHLIQKLNDWLYSTDK